MEFKTEAQQKVYEKADQYLTQVFGEMIRKAVEAPVFFLEKGSAIAQIAVNTWGDDDAVIGVRCYVIYDAELVPDLLMFLLKKNNDMLFGGFGIDDQGDIFFEHSILGSNLDKEEIKVSTLAVLSTADEYDDQIKERWGGLRQSDKL